MNLIQLWCLSFVHIVLAIIFAALAIDKHCPKPQPSPSESEDEYEIIEEPPAIDWSNRKIFRKQLKAK